MPTKSFKIESTVQRFVLALAAVCCLAAAGFFAKWFFAATLAGRAVSLGEQSREVTDLALRLAPADPRARLVSAVLYDRTFLPEDQERSLAEYERAAALSPNDFRYWLELGRARERAGDAARAEIALRRARALAPQYAHVQWTLGNFLLRQGKSEEAFAEIRRAAEGNKDYAGPAVANAWQLFGGDLARVDGYVGDSVNLRAALAAYLAGEKRFEEAAGIWHAMPEALRRSEFRSAGEEIYRKMIEAKKYRAALRLFTDLDEASGERPAAGKIANAGFEAETPKNAGLFEWQIADGTQPLVGRDNTQKRGGELSLTIVFNSADGRDFRQISQTIVVEAGRRYQLEVFARADLKAAATVRWEIVDAADNKLLAATEAVPPKTDWTALRADFAVPEGTEAVSLRLARAPSCTLAICPIAGRVWFDDFALKAR